MTVNPFNLKKDELLVFLTQRCRHGHYYYEHPACFEKEYLHDGKPPRYCILDIEASNLNANFGIMLSYAIKEYKKPKIFARTITADELISETLDKGLVKECVDILSNYDVVITYYGSRFDIPFLRTRAIYWNLDFPKYGYLKHKDVYYMVRNRLKLSRNTLEEACRTLGIKGKTRVDGTYWIKALTGDETALKYILKHNKRDVIILEKLYDKLESYVRNTRRSI